MLTVLLSSHGFDDLLERTEYLQRIDDQDNEIVSRVRDFRNQMQETVNTVKAARNAIAERKAELERTRAKLERRTGELAAARRQRRATLAKVRDQKEELEGDLSDDLGEDPGAAGSARRRSPAGRADPGRAPAADLAGQRPDHLRVRAALGAASTRASTSRRPPARRSAPRSPGPIVLAAYTGGYGNYTCISHGGGLSTCYGHQSSFARTSGSISQGSILGYVGCTGHCTGPHLHFEVRVNGQAVDPLGYL